MTATMDLWPIGNCQVSALVDRNGRFVWGCLPRVDGDPAFSSLLDDRRRGSDGAFGFWEIDLDGCVEGRMGDIDAGEGDMLFQDR